MESASNRENPVASGVPGLGEQLVGAAPQGRVVGVGDHEDLIEVPPGGLLTQAGGDVVAARLREQADRWDLDEILVVTHAHDPAARRRSYELLAEAWRA